MNKELFLIFAGCVLIFSIVAICTGPIINELIASDEWRKGNCKKYSSQYDIEKKNDASKAALDKIKKQKHLCLRKKAMYGLEYSVLIIDLIFAFACTLLGLLHVFELVKFFEKYTGLIGLVTGVIGFILTLVYICYNGYIFTKDNPSRIYKVDKDRAYAEWDDEKKQYNCLYFDKGDKLNMGILAKYSDLGKKQYNYDKDLDEIRTDENEYFHCQTLSDVVVGTIRGPINCLGVGHITPSSGKQYPFDNDEDETKSCKKLYYANSNSNTIDNKYIYDNWVTNIIFTCFIIVCEIGLAIFGFLLFKNAEEVLPTAPIQIIHQKSESNVINYENKN